MHSVQIQLYATLGILQKKKKMGGWEKGGCAREWKNEKVKSEEELEKVIDKREGSWERESRERRMRAKKSKQEG